MTTRRQMLKLIVATPAAAVLRMPLISNAAPVSEWVRIVDAGTLNIFSQKALDQLMNMKDTEGERLFK